MIVQKSPYFRCKDLNAAFGDGCGNGNSSNTDRDDDERGEALFTPTKISKGSTQCDSFTHKEMSINGGHYSEGNNPVLFVSCGEADASSAIIPSLGMKRENGGIISNIEDENIRDVDNSSLEIAESGGTIFQNADWTNAMNPVDVVENQTASCISTPPCGLSTLAAASFADCGYEGPGRFLVPGGGVDADTNRDRGNRNWFIADEVGE